MAPSSPSMSSTRAPSPSLRSWPQLLRPCPFIPPHLVSTFRLLPTLAFTLHSLLHSAAFREPRLAHCLWPVVSAPSLRLYSCLQVLTALAYKFFAEDNVDVAVVEVSA